MARYAIGDVQGCYDELRALLQRIRFSADRDELWFVGDLVNRGPKSLEVLRFLRSLGDNAIVVLGNHDLHLLAVAWGKERKLKRGDTLDEVLAAPDREPLLEWLAARKLAHHDTTRGDLLVHAGLVPQWSAARAAALATEVERALRTDPVALFAEMYGNKPDQWDESLGGAERLRFIINVFTRLRFCTAEGRVDLKHKGPPEGAEPPLAPWFTFGNEAERGARVVCGHWSTLGFRRAHGVVALDTGCVWGDRLSAFDLDADSDPICEPCRSYQAPQAD